MEMLILQFNDLSNPFSAELLYIVLNLVYNNMRCFEKTSPSQSLVGLKFEQLIRYMGD